MEEGKAFLCVCWETRAVMTDRDGARPQKRAGPGSLVSLELEKRKAWLEMDHQVSLLIINLQS